MGVLEDAIAAGDTAKQAELSSFFRDAQANNIQQSDIVGGPGGGTFIPDPAKREAFARIQVAGEAQNRADRQHLSDLVALATGLQHLDPQLQQNILQSLGIGGRGDRPPASVQKAMMDHQRALEVARIQAAGRQGARPQPLPPDIVSAIGTPQFGQRVQAAMSQGQLDRQSFATLAGLDQREREFQARSNKPGRLSPQAQRLREMEALGIPIDGNTIRDIYAPTSMETLTGRQNPQRRQPVSLSALAGLTGGAGPDESTPMPTDQGNSQDQPVYNIGEDKRRQQLRDIITGGATY